MLAFRYVFKDFEKEEFIYKIWTLSELEKGAYKNFMQLERNINLDKHSVDVVSPYTDINGISICANDKIVTKFKDILFVSYSLTEGFYLCNVEERILMKSILANQDLVEDCEIIGNIYISE